MPVIESPLSHSSLFDAGWISLEGRVDGDGDPASLEWFLDQNLVASGPRGGSGIPPKGNHTLTLRSGAAKASIRSRLLAVSRIPALPSGYLLGDQNQLAL